MKKLYLIISILLLLTVSTKSSYALGIFRPDSRLGSASAVRTAAKSQNDEIKIADLKRRAGTEIDRRVTALNGLIARINQIKKLSASQKSDLTSKIQSQIDSLTTLKVKIDVDTDLTTLKTDVKSIVDSYRIFLVFMPQVRLLGAADRLSTVATDLTTVAGKLQARITEAQTAGKDVTQLNLWLSDLNAKAADAQTLSASIVTEVLSLTPEGYPGNKTTLQDAKSKMVNGTQDVKTARQDALSIISQLKTWGLKPSLTPTP